MVHPRMWRRSARRRSEHRVALVRRRFLVSGPVHPRLSSVPGPRLFRVCMAARRGGGRNRAVSLRRLPDGNPFALRFLESSRAAARDGLFSTAEESNQCDDQTRDDCQKNRDDQRGPAGIRSRLRDGGRQNRSRSSCSENHLGLLERQKASLGAHGRRAEKVRVEEELEAEDVGTSAGRRREVGRFGNHPHRLPIESENERAAYRNCRDGEVQVERGAGRSTLCKKDVTPAAFMCALGRLASRLRAVTGAVGRSGADRSDFRGHASELAEADDGRDGPDQNREQNSRADFAHCTRMIAELGGRRRTLPGLLAPPIGSQAPRLIHGERQWHEQKHQPPPPCATSSIPAWRRSAPEKLVCAAASAA